MSCLVLLPQLLSVLVVVLLELLLLSDIPEHPRVVGVVVPGSRLSVWSCVQLSVTSPQLWQSLDVVRCLEHRQSFCNQSLDLLRNIPLLLLLLLLV